MSTIRLTKTVRVLIPVGTSNAAGATTRGGVDLRTAHGGLLTMRIQNGATGPTAQCVMRVLAAHDAGVTPALAGAGAVWKTLWFFGGGVAANAITEAPPFMVEPGTMHLQVEATGNTGQPVTVEAILSEITNATTL